MKIGYVLDKGVNLLIFTTGLSVLFTITTMIVQAYEAAIRGCL